MAKRVILAHPFERVSGNITRSKQKLVYAENDNPAWFAPDGKQYARNFKPQMVLRYDAGREKTSFTIQTKHAVNNTPAVRLRQAIFGGAQAVRQAILSGIDPTTLANIYARYETLKEQYKSFESYMTVCIETALKLKNATINFGGRTGSPVKFNNPWVDGGTGTDVTISADTWDKFAEYLCPVVFLMNGKKYPAADGWNAWVVNHYPEFTASSGGAILYNSENIYNSGGEKMYDTDSFGNGQSYTTTPPNA